MAKFADIFEDVTKEGCKIPQEDYLDEGLYPIIDQGQKQIAGFANNPNGLYYNVPAIIFGDHTRIIKYVDTPCFLGADGVKLLRAKIPNANYKFLYYALSNVKIPNTGYNRHFKWLKEADIQLLSEEQQRKIVAVLDHVNDFISLRKQQLAKLDELVKARFVEMFGDLKSNPLHWPLTPFTAFAEIDGNMTTNFEKYADYPHIGIDSIEKETGVLHGYRTVKQDMVISGKYIFTPEHIIYSKIRPNLNKVALPTFSGLCSADAYPILVKREKCSRVFLAFVMRSKLFLDYILQFSSRTNLPKVNRKEIMGFKMPLPPFDLQKKFEAYFTQVEKRKLTIQQGLDKLEMLKKALMQEYFG